MTTVKVPDDVAALARETAAQANQSLDQFVTALLTSQLEARGKFAELQARGARGDRTKLREILDRVPSVPPLLGDEL